jgi:hypothetical protein
MYMWEVKIQESVQAKHVEKTFWKNGSTVRVLTKLAYNSRGPRLKGMTNA